MTEAQVFTAPLETLRKRILEATASLLGDTIGISELDWAGASRLPGWSRANVAAHLAANADALARLISASQDGIAVDLYPDDGLRSEGIERGSTLSGLELQILLDTSAGRLERAMDAVEDWSRTVAVNGRTITLAHLPLARLSEVVLHHLDLNTGFGLDGLDLVPARWLMQWALAWHGDDSGLPPVRIESTSGVVADLGADGDERRTVRGSDVELYGWFMGRADGSQLVGADGLHPQLRS